MQLSNDLPFSNDLQAGAEGVAVEGEEGDIA
jgi:hypothetical protein